jgi:hypothetical protein
LSAAASRFFTRKMSPISTRKLTTDFRLAATKSLRSRMAPADWGRVTLVIRRIMIAVLAAFLAGAVLAAPASSKTGPAVVAKKKAKKCKKAKKGRKAKKRKGCKRGSSSAGLPGEATPASPQQPNSPPPPDNAVLQVESVALTSGTVLGGNSTNGQVTLDHAAPAGGQQVDLTSDLSARAQVPASVVVVAGSKTAGFQVDTTSGPSPVTATLTASIGTSNATAPLKIVDRPSVASVKLARQCFTAPSTWTANRVTLDIPAPDDTDVTLDSSDPLSLFLPLTTITVPEDSTSALFTVNALAPPVVPGSVTVTATAPSTPPQSDSAPVSLGDPPTHADDLTLDPDTVTPDTVSHGTVTLDCEAPSGGTVVTLLSQDQAHVAVPTTVTVPAGALSVDFDITTAADTPDDNYDISANVQDDPPANTVQTTLHVVSVLPT